MLFEKMKKIETFLEKWFLEKPISLAIWMMLSTLLICIVISFVLLFPNISSYGNLKNLGQTGPLGDTFNGLLGPFIAFLVAILTFFAFYVQFKANEQQNTLNTLQQFESKFFELLRLHRDNISELKYTKYYDGSMQTSEGRKVMKVIFDEFNECLHEVRHFLNSTQLSDYYLESYYNKIKKIYSNNNLKLDLIEVATIEIAFCITFYGIGKEGRMALKKILQKKYKDTYFLPLLDYISLKPKEEKRTGFRAWEQLHKLNYRDFKDSIKKVYYYEKPGHEEVTLNSDEAILYNNTKHLPKYYGGHQHRLGHYFRHLFQSYKFLSGQKSLEFEKKYFYGKTFRAQLSTYEQALLLVNSITCLGLKWELNPEVEVEDINLSTEEKNQKYKMITSYNLIKNLPGNRFYSVKYTDFYPKVKYELNEL